MKIRSDFVTNSSSSSFIVGKKDDNQVTVDYVFNIIKSLYKEYLNNRDALIKHITDNKKLGIEYVESSGNFERKIYEFRFKDDTRFSSKNTAIRKQIERDFNVDMFDVYEENYDWLKCNSYQEYEDFWIHKINNSDTYCHAPFSIYDFLENKEIYYLENGGSISNGIEKEKCTVDHTSDVLQWYFPYFDEVMSDIQCDECSNKGWCDKEECHYNYSVVHDIKFEKGKECLYFLGRICISSECGYIPNYIVHKLSLVSEYSCNHMG